MSSKFGVSVDDVRAYPWQDLITASPKKEMMAYHTGFSQAGAACQNAGDSRGVNVYRFLGGLTSWMPSYDDSDNKYRPMFDGEIAAQDYEEGDLEVFEALLPEVKDPEFKSRVADLLWIRRKKKSPDHARVAVQAFLQSATTLEDDKCDCIFTGRVRRATQLSAILGRDKQLFRDTVAHVEGLIHKYSEAGKPWICADLMNILLEFGAGDRGTYALLCGRIAKRLEHENEFSWAQGYWRFQSRWFHGAGDQEASRGAVVNEAEAIVLEADAATKRPTPSFAAAKTLLARGIEALRRAGGRPERIEELRRLHAEYARKSMGELSTISVEGEDYSEHVANVMKAVSEQPLEQALLWLASIPPTNTATLRKTVLSGGPMSSLFATDYLNEEGKTVARSKGAAPTAKEIEETHVKAKMFEMAGRVNWNVLVQSTIFPAMAQINWEHNVQPDDLSFLVRHNAVVAPGREEIIARALVSGLRGDWLVVVHLVPPQIEHMLRFILAQQGKLTSSLDSEGIEAEYPLGKLLCEIPEVVATLGEDLAFDLRGILVEKPGANLRNRMGHGLMSYAAFYDANAVYLWWLLLKLCSLPIFEYLERLKSPPAANS